VRECSPPGINGGIGRTEKVGFREIFQKGIVGSIFREQRPHVKTRSGKERVSVKGCSG